MKKPTMLLFTVLLFLMWSKPGSGQQQMSDQKNLSIEEQVQILNEEIKTSDTLVNDIDDIIVLYQQQKNTLVNKRAELNALKVILDSGSVINSRPHGVSKGPTGDAVLGTAGALAAAGMGNIVGATVAEARVVNNALNAAIHNADERNAKIEQTLKEQRDWKRDHPGHNG